MAMIPNRDLWDIIAIVIALDLLYNNFDTMTASLLETGDKSIDKTQNILESKETKNISKCTTRRTRELPIAFRDNNGLKQKAFSHKECFNYHKLEYFGRDCPNPNKKQTNLQIRNNLQLPIRSDPYKSNTI